MPQEQNKGPRKKMIKEGWWGWPRAGAGAEGLEGDG